jgi:threonine dehydrogenase-like Zn-dependent dehydrogenase
MTMRGDVGDQVMWALVRDADGVAPRRVATPKIEAGDDVVVAVRAAGVCRTDLRVADEVGPSVILGHEAAGVVAVAGPAAAVEVGAAVMVVPMGAGGWLGVDRDGVFAERVRVRAADVRRLPAGMGFAVGAYVEPVAAAMGALRGVTAGARVRIGGAGRIAELTARVVTAAGAHVVTDGEVDVAIETDGETASLTAALRPGGMLVMNGRIANRAEVDRAALAAKDLGAVYAPHGDFGAAIDWLAMGRVEVADLMAPARPLAAWREVLADARSSEARKQMFAVGDD